MSGFPRVDPLNIPLSQKGAASGVAALDANSNVVYPLEDKGGQVFNVNAYGARPDAGVTDATIGIQAAINACSAAGGGRVVSQSGTYTCKTAPVVGPNSSAYCLSVPSNVTLDMNPGATLTIANGLNAGIVFLQSSASMINVGLFLIDGNKANQTDGGLDGGQCGIYGSNMTYFNIDTICQNNVRQGVYISNSSWGTINCRVNNNGLSTNTCAGFEDDANNDCVFNVLALNNLGPGVHWAGGASLLDNKTVLTVVAYGNQFGVLGYFKQGGLLKVIAQGNTTDGVILENCSDCTVDGYYDTNSRHGAYDYLGTRNTIRGTARNNTNTSFNVYGSTSTVIDSPQDSGAGAMSIGVDSTSVGCHVSGGRITGGVSDAGSGTVIHNVAGYNPVGVVTPAVPATGVAVAAVNYDRVFYITTSAATSVAIQNGPTITLPTTGLSTVRVPAGKTLTPTYASTAPTWVVEGE